MSRYTDAMEKAGANVLAYEHFGSYQGDAWALVEYDGKRGWVTYSFGSCSGCDSYEAQHFYGPYRNDYDSQEEYDAAVAELDKRIADFGRDYLSEILTQEEAEKRAAKHSDWDMEADSVLRFIRSCKDMASS